MAVQGKQVYLKPKYVTGQCLWGYDCYPERLKSIYTSLGTIRETKKGQCIECTRDHESFRRGCRGCEGLSDGWNIGTTK